MLNLVNNPASGQPNAFATRDMVKISVFGFALAALANGLHVIILPIRVMELVPASQKNTYLGLLTFTGLAVAMIVQPFTGALSDCSLFGWGRRRPYILGGTLAVMALLIGVGAAGSIAALFVFWCLTQAGSNVAQGAYQGFIPDLVPEEKRGRASGIKTLFEVVGGVMVLRLIGVMAGRETKPGDIWLWLSLGTLALLILAAMIFTIFRVKETACTAPPQTSRREALKGTFIIETKARPAYINFLVSRLLFLMALATLQAFMLYYLEDVVKLQDAAAATANMLIVVGVTMIAVVYPTGYLSDRIGRKPVGVAAGILGAVGTGLLLTSHRYGFSLICGGVIGIAAGAFLSSNWALATDLVHKGEEGRYMGLSNLATAGGAALARLIGPVIDFFNAQKAGTGYTVMLAACAVYFLAGAFLLFRVKKASNNN